MNKQPLKSKRKIIITAAVVFVLAVVVGACAIYLGDCYRADIDAIQAFLPQETQWEEQPDGTIVFAPENAEKGFIFYPGGKVEYTAYLPLMQALSEQGVLCILVEMPFNLAVFDMYAADGIQNEYPEIASWYIGGHSLGGAMAASYLASDPDAFAGLVLLGAYSTADLSDSHLAVLSVYGSEDTVMNRTKYENNISNLPTDFTEVILDGGCHANFGMYGTQAGDGTPDITREEQIAQTVAAIVNMMEQEKKTMNTYRRISMEEAVVMMQQEQDYIILDVRRADEYAAGHIPNAINIANEDIGSQEIPALPDRDQLIMVYCRSGRRSKEASEKLAALGYTNIVEFGGILDWTGETVSGN